ncbi:MAG: sterol desaturase family protein [Polyangiaceae bacterium]|nr:sterol desaturase family protein [Polyangiaceae bacterium]
MMRASNESPRMFDSDVVDFFSRTHPIVVPLLYVPATVALLWYGVARAGVGAAASVLYFLLGLVVWSLSEYWLHRTVFHWQPNARWGARMHFLIHGVHHRWPRDKYRLVMPPAASLLAAALFFGLFYLLLGARVVWPFHAGFVVGYVTYDLTHYYIHHYNPKSSYGRRLKRHHMLHHFKDTDSRFGVSTPVWDSVFGTRGQP